MRRRWGTELNGISYDVVPCLESRYSGREFFLLHWAAKGVAVFEKS